MNVPKSQLCKFYPQSDGYKHISQNFWLLAFVHSHARQIIEIDPNALNCVFISYSLLKKGIQVSSDFQEILCLWMLPFMEVNHFFINLIFRRSHLQKTWNFFPIICPVY